MKFFKILSLIFLTAFIFSCSKKTNEVAATTKSTAPVAESRDSASDDGERRGRRGEGRRGNPEERAKREAEMYAQLNLSEAQQTKVKEINEKYRTKMRTARENSDGDRDAIRANMMKMRDEQHAELKNIMTAEQFEKFKKIQEAQRGKRGGRRGGGRGN